jgi:hypothetical protein
MYAFKFKDGSEFDGKKWHYFLRLILEFLQQAILFTYVQIKGSQCKMKM